MPEKLIKNKGKAWPACQAFFLCLSLGFFLAGCLSVEYRQSKAENLLEDYGYQSAILQAGPFMLFSARPTAQTPTEVLPVVIEGDGFAWQSIWQPSENPTPRDPVGLHIAAGLSPPALYLARPCQYVQDKACALQYWTDKRFSAEVIRSYMAALDQLKHTHGNRGFRLTGYSGGAYIALVLAAMRSDVVVVTTVGGVLDPDAWVAHHDLSALDVPLDFGEIARHTKALPFRHICSPADDIVPCSLAHKATEGRPNHDITEVQGTHDTLWRSALLHLNGPSGT